MDLLGRPCCNVAEGPGCFLLDHWLCVPQQPGQDSQGTSINGFLGLLVCACDHIPNGTESWSLDRD